MLHRDFASHPLAKQYDIPNLLCVGWLGNDDKFKTGQLPPNVLKKLNLLLKHPIRSREGLISCQLCGKSSGAIHSVNEFWVRDHKGTIYVAPGIIHHYVNYHHYVPPGSYVDAIKRIGAFFRRSVIMQQDEVAQWLALLRKASKERAHFEGLGV